jgi:hypothetical protein
VTDDVYRISLSDWKCGEVVPGNSSHVSKKKTRTMVTVTLTMMFTRMKMAAVKTMKSGHLNGCKKTAYASTTSGLVLRPNWESAMAPLPSEQ